jgi:hypothetical protein
VIRGPVLVQASCVAVYVAACAAFAMTWEVTHDEGVTWLQAFGSLPIPRWPMPPVSMLELTPVLDGQAPRSGFDVVAALRGPEGMHPPAYYLLLNTWAGLFGTGSIAMALPPVAWGVACLLGVRRLAERVAGGSEAGLWAMSLMAVSPWFLGFTILSRPYALALCLGVWATNAAFELADESSSRSARSAGVFALLSVTGLYVIYHYAFVLVWHFGWLAIVAWSRRESRWPDLGRLAALGVVVCAGFAPWLPRLLEHLERTGAGSHYFAGTLGPSEWAAATGQLFALFGLAEALQSDVGSILLVLLALLAAITLPLVGISFSSRGGDRDGRPGARVARLWWMTVPLLPLSIGVADYLHDAHTLFLTKTGFLLLPVSLALVVRGWMLAGIGPLSRVGLAAWALIFATASVADLRLLSANDSPFESAARTIAADDRPDHLVLLASMRPGYAVPLLLSLQRAGVQQVAIGYTSEGRLREIVESPDTRKRYRSLTLVNFEATDPRLRWSEQRLRRLLSEASAAGWQLEGDASAVERAIPEPRLRILGPLRSKSFAM